MRRFFLLFVFIGFFLTQARATTINVNVDNNFFSPVSFSVQIGDTIKWTLVAGTHTTTSTSVPSGAASWNHIFSGIGDSFSYVVLVEGVYEYVCTFHPGMLGSFSTQMSLPFIENFNYPANENLTFHGWVAHSGAGTQPQTTVSPGLSFPGYPSSGIGNAALLDNTGEDTHRLFETVTTSAVYMSFMVKVDVAQVGYFIHFTPNPHNTFDFRGRVWVNASGSNLSFKFSYASSDTISTPFSYAIGQTYVLVVKYEVVSGALNDIVSLFVFAQPNPLPGTEPVTPTLGPIINTTGSVDINPGSVSLRQFNAAQNITVDGIRVSTNWSELIPVELTAFSASASGSDVILNWTTATELNNYGFEIQRSVTANEFMTIGFVAGNGTTTETKNYSFVDANLASGSYSYRLKQLDYDGTFSYSDEVSADVTAPMQFELAQNYPNPFNPSTNINFTIPQSSEVTLKVYNALGQETASLIDGFMEAGPHTINFDASSLNSGIYFYRLNAGQFSEVRKMTLIK